VGDKEEKKGIDWNDKLFCRSNHTDFNQENRLKLVFAGARQLKLVFHDNLNREDIAVPQKLLGLFHL